MILLILKQTNLQKKEKNNLEISYYANLAMQTGIWNDIQQIRFTLYVSVCSEPNCKIPIIYIILLSIE